LYIYIATVPYRE